MTAAKTTPETPTLLVCNCQKTMRMEAQSFGQVLGQILPLTVHTELCRGGIGAYHAALATGGSVHVACTQEAPLFREVATAKGFDADQLTFTNIRERAGWCDAKSGAQAKMVALLAEAAHVSTPASTTTLSSQGICLVYGRGQQALDVAAELSTRLSVSVLLTNTADAIPPNAGTMQIAKGRIRKARGHLGAFEIEVDGYAPMLPSSRKHLDFALARNGAKSTCDLIVDISGETPLFADSARRDGYLRADPGASTAIAKLMFKATDLVGEFEKPIYVNYDASICAHSRSGKTGCTKCLDICPTGAITSAGDHVAIDAGVCGGCGSCSAVCPTGAVEYAYPARNDLIARMQILLTTYAKAGGQHPVLLLHDETHGGGLVAALARHGRGLPPNVLPLGLHEISELGHETLAAALVLGAEHIVLLGSPKHAAELAVAETQIALLGAFQTGLGYSVHRTTLIATDDPDVLGETLFGLKPTTSLKQIVLPAHGTKRDLTRTVFASLHAQAPQPADWIALPKGAPYGRANVKAAGCTLCLACVGACPANALADHPERPQLSFTQSACVQCGICTTTCPEQVITLEPGYDFTTRALSPAILHAEEPARCVSCDKPFGTKSTIDKVLARLKGRHAMYQNDAQLRLIQMCDTCRIVHVSEAGNDPMRVGERPRVRTTADYLDEAAALKKKTPDDFLS